MHKIKRVLIFIVQSFCLVTLVFLLNFTKHTCLFYFNIQKYIGFTSQACVILHQKIIMAYSNVLLAYSIIFKLDAMVIFNFILKMEHQHRFFSIFNLKLRLELFHTNYHKMTVVILFIFALLTNTECKQPTSLISFMNKFNKCDILVIQAASSSSLSKLDPLKCRQVLMKPYPTTKRNRRLLYPAMFARYFQFQCTAIFFILIDNEETENGTSIKKVFQGSPVLRMTRMPQYMFFIYNFTQHVSNHRDVIWNTIVDLLKRAVPDIGFLTISSTNNILKLESLCLYCRLLPNFSKTRKFIPILGINSSELANNLIQLSTQNNNLQAYFWVLQLQNRTVYPFQLRHDILPSQTWHHKYNLNETFQLILFEGMSKCNPFNHTWCLDRLPLIPAIKTFRFGYSSDLSVLKFPRITSLHYYEHLYIDATSGHRNPPIRTGGLQVDASKAFYNFLTCDSINYYAQTGCFMLLAPLDRITWILILTSIIFLCISINVCVTESFNWVSLKMKFLEITGVLMEKPIKISTKLKHAEVILIIVWLTSSFTLLNTYRSLFTTDVIVPFQVQSPWTSFEQMTQFNVYCPDSDFFLHITRTIQAERSKKLEVQLQNIKAAQTANMFFEFYQKKYQRPILLRYDNDSVYFKKVLNSDSCHKKAYIDINENIDLLLHDLNKKSSTENY